MMVSGKKPIVIMAERSDIYRDARVIKEANSLAENDYEVHVWGFRSKWKKEEMQVGFNLKTIPIVSREYRWLRNLQIALNVLMINVLLIFKKADYYHAHNTMFLLGMYLSSRIHGGKFVYDSHEVQWELNRISAFLEKRFIHKVDTIINVSQGRAKAQSVRYAVSSRKITVVANYPIVSDSAIDIQKPRDDRLRCIFSGGFNIEDNRLDYFLYALAEIPQIDFHLLAFGYGESESKLLRLIDSLDLKDRVKFLPLVTPDKVIETISKYDFAVNFLMSNEKYFLSYQYPAINKMYEYLAAGLPVLTSRLPAFIDDFEKEGVGMCVDPECKDSIKAGLNYYIEKKENLVSMKQRALELSRDKYNWKTQETILLDVYDKLTNE